MVLLATGIVVSPFGPESVPEGSGGDEDISRRSL
jgi:hypothetical protein